VHTEDGILVLLHCLIAFYDRSLPLALSRALGDRAVISMDQAQEIGNQKHEGTAYLGQSSVGERVIHSLPPVVAHFD
jgi:hypothetical protein